LPFRGSNDRITNPIVQLPEGLYQIGEKWTIS
jgi:hypothetical protein